MHAKDDEAEALRQRVVEAAMARNKAAWRGEDLLQLNARLADACLALDAALTRASSPAPDAVREAAGRLRAGQCSGVTVLGPSQLADLKIVLDALGAKGGS